MISGFLGHPRMATWAGLALSTITWAGAALAQDDVAAAPEPAATTTAADPTPPAEAAPAPAVAPEAAPQPSPGPAAEPAPAEPAPVAPAPAEPAPAKPAPAKRPWTDYIKPKADMRYRIELIDTPDTELRYRHRLRARAGLASQIAKSFEAELQIGTGEGGDPVSNNQTMTEVFTSKPVWLSRAYFHWHPGGWADGLHLWGGKMPNPYVAVGESELLWDPDLSPEGMALGYDRDFGVVQPILTGGAFFLEERKEDDDAWLFGAQLSFRFQFLDDALYFQLGGGYFNFAGLEGQEALWDPTDSFGNAATPVDPAAEDSPVVYDNDYDVLESFLEVGGEIGEVPWAVFGSTAYNLAIGEDNFGWLAGASVGETHDTFDLYARYIYRQVQSDYTFALFTDSDFRGGGTDGKGHEWNLGFVVYKPITLGVTYFYNQAPYDDGTDYHRAQFDLSMKF